METRLLSILPKKVKKVGEQIVFTIKDPSGSEVEFPGKLSKIGNNYYFCGINRRNNYIFHVLGLDTKEVSYKVLGYYEEGNWPEARTIDDFNKMLNYLRSYEEI